jgi:predicted XRE-type DNA-binding protein
MKTKTTSAAVMGLRADLMGRLRLLVQTEGWTQAQAAERFPDLDQFQIALLSVQA